MSPHILIVDDEPSVAFFLHHALLSMQPDYVVSTACTGEEALRLTQDESPDVIITDYRLKDMDGLLLAAAVKRLGREIPVIMITAGPAPASDSITTSDILYCIQKPFSTSHLIGVIGEVLAKGGATSDPGDGRPWGRDRRPPGAPMSSDGRRSPIESLALRSETLGQAQAGSSETAGMFSLYDNEASMLRTNGNLALSQLLPGMVERRYPKGQILYMPGDPSDTVFLLKAGRVEQYHLSLEGRKLVTVLLKPGDIFGTTAVANGHGRHVFAETLDDCVVHVLERHQLRELLLRDPQAVLLLIGKLARRLNRAEKKLAELVFDPIPVRLARCLIETAESGVVDGFSHQDISEMLGAYRETITVTLNEFKEQGLIDIERRRIVIRDMAGLSHLATGDENEPHAMHTPDGTMPMVGHQPMAA